MAPYAANSEQPVSDSNSNNNNNSNAAASPSPSPALSAYSYTSSTSSSSDHDLNSLSLDDWGYSTQPTKGDSRGMATNRFNVSTAYRGQDHISGMMTPMARQDSSSTFAFSEKTGLEADETVIGPRGEEIEGELDDDEELEPYGSDFEDEDEEDMHAHGVPAARGWRLDAR
jgi:choline kinase